MAQSLFPGFESIAKFSAYHQFINQLESTLPGTRDGKVNKEELQQGYDRLLAQASDQIPQEIKNRFKDGQAFADQFEQIDALGVADGYVDTPELLAFSRASEVPPEPDEARYQAE